MEILQLIGRVIFGGFFLYNALNHLFMGTDALTGYAQYKGVPAPRLMVYLSGLLMLLGGPSIMLGFEPRWGIALLLLFLFPVSFKMHAFWKEQGDVRLNDMINFQKNMALAGAALVLLAIPEPWPLSLGG
ncbi:MAG: DoxX family protein [Gemmatimonadetes bacterium]|nr:DoxX family protein [Gemmatimonadota bacterium]